MVKGFSIAGFRDELSVSADPQGLCLHRGTKAWPDPALRDGAWLLAMLQSDELVSEGYASPEPRGWTLPADRIDAALAAGFTLPLLWSGWSPFRLRLWAGLEGTDGLLRVRYGFRDGGSSVALERRGRYVRRPSTPGRSWLLDVNTTAILDVVDRLMTEPPASAGSRSRVLSWLRDSGTEIGAELLGCLAPGRSASREPAEPHEDESWPVDSEGVSYTTFLQLSPSMLEACVAALYQHRGCKVALLPPGNGFGAAVLARSGRILEVAFVDTKPTSSPLLLESILATESCIRATMPVSGLVSTVYSRSERDPAACAPLVRRGIGVIAGRLFAERLRSRGVNREIAATWQKYRCKTFADSIRGLFEVTC